MFQAIHSSNESRSIIGKFANAFLSAKRNVPATVCFEAYFSQMSFLRALDAFKLLENLDLFLTSLRNLKELMSGSAVISNISHLFSARSLNRPNSYAIDPASVLHRTTMSLVPGSRKNASTTITRQQLLSISRSFLETRTTRSIQGLHDGCLESPLLQPCFVHQPTEQEDLGCDKVHITTSDFGTWYTAWVAIHLKELSICSHLKRLESRESFACIAW